jgi:hypothetical protein
MVDLKRPFDEGFVAGGSGEGFAITTPLDRLGVQSKSMSCPKETVDLLDHVFLSLVKHGCASQT